MNIPPAKELNLRITFRPGFFEPMDVEAWRMVMEINPKTGYHHLVIYDKNGEEVFSHDGMTGGIATIEFLDSRFRE